MITLYRHALSGHSHRVQLFLSLLELDYELVDVDLAGGAHKAPDFLKLNAFGQVPVLEDGAVMLADSNAILVYLARTYGKGRWLPALPVGEAQVQRWLSVAAGQVAYGPASARLVNVFGAVLDHERAKTIAANLFAVMEAELGQQSFLVGEEPTIADIANYSYIAHAPEGDVSLEPFPGIREWLKRIEALPGFVPMQATEVGLAA
ncbi:MAG: glutathione S-transferase [Pseudomonadota bacterium]